MRIRQLRLDKGITQEDLADLLKTDTRQIGRIENAEVFTNLKTIIKIAVALEVDIKELFEFDHQI